jgi:polysaccharide export outer membrane protein
MKIRNKFKLITLIIITLQFSSCSSKKDILYFQTNEKSTFDGKLLLDQKIEENDILSVRINSKDIETSRLYNLDLTENFDRTQQPQVLKNLGYLVNNLGQIKLPILGNIQVNKMSIYELESFLTKRLIDEGHLIDPTVIVRVLNCKVTVLGEVKMPGTYEFVEKNLTLLQAIGLAGDLTINGKRNDVILIRQENNTKTITHIDLTSTNWFETKNYYIKQNDVIVVNPNNAKIKSAGILGNAGTFISLISLLLTGFLLIKK